MLVQPTVSGTVNFKYLGYSNGWKVDPPEIVEHDRLVREQGREKHPTTSVHSGCHHLYICPACGIEWRTDSSD